MTLRIFLTISVPTASCERGFSKLKLIKMYQNQERLSNLAILSTERDSDVDFNTVIDLMINTNDNQAILNTFEH